MDCRTQVELKGQLIGIDWEGEGAHALIVARAEKEPGAKLETLRGEILELRQNERQLLNLRVGRKALPPPSRIFWQKSATESAPHSIQSSASPRS